MNNHMTHLFTNSVLTEKAILFSVTFEKDTTTEEILVSYSGTFNKDATKIKGVNVNKAPAINETFSGTLRGTKLDILRQACKERIENNCGNCIAFG